MSESEYKCDYIEETGELIISGSGKLFLNALLYDYPDAKRLIVGNGFRTISSKALPVPIRGYNITSIQLPETLTEIGTRSFEGCWQLEAITIPDSVTSIGVSAFCMCTSLRTIVIPNSLSYLAPGAFKACNSLQSIEVAKNNQEYCSDDGVLLNKTETSLLRYPPRSEKKEYHIPDWVTTIESDAFENCTSLEYIHIPNSVTVIDSNAFERCTSLEYIHIPNSVTTIGYQAFQECTSLRSIALPNSVTYIGSRAFERCTSLESIYIPNSVDTLYCDAFQGCKSLKSITISEKASESLKKLIKDNLPENVEIIQKKENIVPPSAREKKDIKPLYDISGSQFEPVLNPGIKFDDVVGLEEAKQKIYDNVILPILRPDLFDSMDIQKGDGVLLYGPPGTGKTMFAKAVATEIDAAFFEVKASDLTSPHPGETEARIKELFETARAYETAIIFFDEFESLGMSRDIGFNQDIYGRNVTELLAQMDGFTTSPTTLILMAATNRPWDIDSALIRPGRLGNMIYVGLPNEEAREKILENHFANVDCGPNIDFRSIAEATEGFNGADMAELSKRIKLNAIRRNINNSTAIILEEDVTEALNEIRPSAKREDLKRFEKFTRENKR